METKFLQAIVVIAALIAVPTVPFIVKFLIFMCKGGTFTQVARNATHLYCQIVNVYPRMPKYTAMYMALMMNSYLARDRMPESLIRSLVKSVQGADLGWADAVCIYTEHWFNNVGRTSQYRAGSDSKLDSDLRGAVSEAARDIFERGSTRYEDELRALPQSVVMSYVVQYDEFDIR